MTNADKFKSLFGLYATELWAMPEKDFLKWLNSEVDNCSESPNSSDTVSRQAAIDAADSETVSTNPEHFKSSEKFIKFVDDDDIASFGRWQWANGFNTVLVASKVQLEKLPSAQSEQRWIPCSDRMPETGVEVLTYDEALNYIEIQTFSDGRWENQRGDWQDLDDIAAWMPLPEPYQKGATP